MWKVARCSWFRVQPPTQVSQRLFLQYLLLSGHTSTSTHKNKQLTTRTLSQIIHVNPSSILQPAGNKLAVLLLLVLVQQRREVDTRDYQRAVQLACIFSTLSLALRHICPSLLSVRFYRRVFYSLMMIRVRVALHCTS